MSENDNNNSNKKSYTHTRSTARRAHRLPQKYLIAIAVVAVLVLLYIGSFFKGCGKPEGMVYVPKHATTEMVVDSIRKHCGDDMAGKVKTLLLFNSVDWEKRVGAYKVGPETSAFKLARRLHSGAQSPVRVAFTNVRTMDQLARIFDRKLQMSRDEFLKVAYSDSTLHMLGNIKREELPAFFIPDTYEFYWGVSPKRLISTMHDCYDRYWTDERKQKAEAEGLTPIEVSTIASIVQEETASAKEYPKVARLYINRYKKGMRLQADPTVKFAIGDFSIRRITGEMLKTDSPYNTYRVTGLPPGPIRFATKSGLDAVLNADKHDYLYMCAKEDFSGTHNFATTYAEHMLNARRYQAALNARGIH